MKYAAKAALVLSLIILLGCFNIFQAGQALPSSDNRQGRIVLTDTEKKFILEHPVIRLGIDPSFVPYEFFDSDGAYKGMAADYIDLICKETGLRMIPEKGLTWIAAYEKAVIRELDVLPCVSNTQQRRESFLFSSPYLEFQRAIFVNRDNNSVKSLNDLSGKATAVQMNTSHQGFLNSNYPAVTQNLYPNVDEALKAVSAGRESYFIGNLATTSYLIKSLGITNLKYIPADSRDDLSLYFAVRTDWPELVGIINKALAAITQEEKISINNKWLGLPVEPDYSNIIRIAGIAGGVILLILAVSGFWIVRLRREVKKRQKAQEELVLAKEEAEQAKEEAERANQIKSLFLARMSHEVRTPLHAIMGMAYLFKKTDMTVTQSIYLDKLLQAARNMLGIINDILDFSKIEAGKIEIEKVPFDLDNVLQRVLNIETVRVTEQEIELNVHKAPDIPQCFIGDPTRVEQVLLNILSNAVKFTKKGGVTLTVDVYQKTDTIYTVEFCVRDTGIGMTEAQLARLFIPFDQGDSTISRHFGGTGLGMSIVKNLVDLMGGTIHVVSIPNEGTTFTVRLPLETEGNSGKTEIQNMAADCFRNLRALVLDKSEAGREPLERCLRAFGISADWAATEYDALLLSRRAAAADDRPYNLMLVDYQTPDDNGIAYIQRRKKQSAASKMKYILMIPLAREELFEEIEAAGIDIGMTKPIIPSVLYNAIIEVCGFKPQENKKTAKAPERGRAPYPYRILLVEDNRTNQFIAGSILNQAGFVVSQAEDGGEGYRYFQENRGQVDLILMDIHMPDMDGYTASDLIREIDPDVPIVAMTADAVAGIADKCRSHGMSHFISKPFEPDALVDTLLEILGDGSKAPVSGREPAKREARGPILNRQDGLRRIGGDQELYRLILREYRNENRDILEQLKATLAVKDFAASVQIVHKIKSSSGNIGAGPLYDTASGLQKALTSGDEDTAGTLFEAFSAKLVLLMDEITQQLNLPEI